jgi:hypothetical protein
MADNNTIILKLQLEEAQSKVKIKKLNQELEDLDGRTKEYRESVAKLNLEEQKLINTRKKLSQSTTELIGDNKQGLNGVSKASGGATAAAMELGRVVSDAPYGIRGMANNVSQLASQLFYMAGQQVTATTATNTDTVAKGANTTATVVATGATVGFAGALRMMWSALMGPMGVLLGIQAVISGLDFFYGANKKAEESSKDLTKEVYASGLVAKQYVKELQDVNLTEERRKVVTQEVLDLIPTLKKEDLEYGKNLDKVRLKIKQYTLAQAARLEVEKLVNQNSALLSKQMRVDLVNSTEDQEEKVKIIKGLLKEEGIELEKAVNQSYQMGQANLTLRKKTNDELIQDFKDLSKKIKKESKPILEQIDNLSQGLALDPSKNGDGKGKIKLLEIDDFDKQAEDYLDKIASVSEKEEILNAELNSDKVLIQERYHLERLKATHLQNQSKFKQQADAYRIEYKAFLDQQVRITDLTKEEAKVKLDDFDNSTKSEQKKSEDNYKILIEKWKSYYFDKVFIALQAEQKIKESKKTETETEFKELDKLQTYFQEYKKLMSGVTEFLDGEFERQLTMEQNKTNVLNKELNDRLINENLSAEQRKNIQNQIAQNDENLRVKQDAINKKKFKQTKALNLSMALIDTYAGATQVLADKKLPSWAKIPMMVSIIGSGLAQVAAISRQKFQSSSAATPINTTGGGGGAGATERADPSFNVVGRSNENLLINAIQAQFDKPLKAYVVSRDVTNQQQLDGMIVSQAGT